MVATPGGHYGRVPTTSSTAHCTVYTEVNYIYCSGLYTPVHYILQCTEHCTALYIVQCTLHCSVHCIVYTVMYTALHCTLQSSVKCHSKSFPGKLVTEFTCQHSLPLPEP